MAVANKTIQVVGAFLKDTQNLDGDASRYGIYIGMNETTSAAGAKTISVPATWDAIVGLWCQAETLGTGASVAPTYTDSTRAVAYGGTAATTFHYIAIVRRQNN